jgi:hypothetical protein
MGASLGIWFNVGRLKDGQGLFSRYSTTPVVGLGHQHFEGPLANARINKLARPISIGCLLFTRKITFHFFRCTPS